MHNKILFAILIISSLFSFCAFAGSSGGSFGVLASVNNNCSVSANNFTGAYDPLSPVAMEGSNDVTVLCTLGTSFHVRLDKGIHGSDVTHRQLSDGLQALNYQAFRDSGHTLNWGETDGVDTIDSIATGAGQVFPVYGRVAALQVVSPGVYSDTLTVTVSF